MGESAEVSEMVKKILFQGKPFNEDNRNKIIDELGDVLFYLNVGLLALDISLDDIMKINHDKLAARYPNGFSIQRSEKRDF